MGQRSLLLTFKVFYKTQHKSCSTKKHLHVNLHTRKSKDLQNTSQIFKAATALLNTDNRLIK